MEEPWIYTNIVIAIIELNVVVNSGISKTTVNKRFYISENFKEYVTKQNLGLVYLKYLKSILFVPQAHEIN